MHVKNIEYVDIRIFIACGSLCYLKNTSFEFGIRTVYATLNKRSAVENLLDRVEQSEFGFQPLDP
jgi:hypothetical protein